MQHPSKPLAKTRQGTLAGSAEQGFISGAAFRTPRRPWPAARAAASRPLAGVRPAENFPPPAGRTLTTAASSAAGSGAFSEDCISQRLGPGQRSAAAAGDGLAARRRVYHRRRQPAALRWQSACQPRRGGGDS